MKKTVLLVLMLLSGLLLIGCTNVRRDLGYKVLDVEDIKDLDLTISIKVRTGVVNNALETLVEDFHDYQVKEYGRKFITVDIMTISGSYDELRSTTILDINSKNEDNIPDLIMGYPDHFAEYYGGGNLVNLQAFMDDPKVGFTKEEMDDFIEGYMPENRGFDVDEKTGEPTNDYYGLPFNKSTEVMVYNKTALEKIFNKEGENYLDKIPATWDELRTVSEEIIERVKAGALDDVFVESYDPDKDETTYLKVSDYLNPSNLKFYPFGYDSSANAFITLTRQFGGEYTKRQDVFTGTIHFDNAKSKAAMKYVQDMRKDGIFATAAVLGGQYNSDAIKLIQVLMSVGSSAGVGYNTSDKYPYELGFAPIPYYSEDAKYVIQQGTNIGMLNWNTDEEKLAAWLFIKFLMEPENTAQFAMDTGGYLPVRKSAYETDDYKEYLENPTIDKREFSAAANVALNEYINKGFSFFVDPAFIGSSKVRNEVERVFDSIIVNLADIDARYKEAYNALAPYVPKDN